MLNFRGDTIQSNNKLAVVVKTELLTHQPPYLYYRSKKSN